MAKKDQKNQKMTKKHVLRKSGQLRRERPLSKRMVAVTT